MVVGFPSRLVFNFCPLHSNDTCSFHAGWPCGSLPAGSATIAFPAPRYLQQKRMMRPTKRRRLAKSISRNSHGDVLRRKAVRSCAVCLWIWCRLCDLDILRLGLGLIRLPNFAWLMCRLHQVFRSFWLLRYNKQYAGISTKLRWG